MKFKIVAPFLIVLVMMAIIYGLKIYGSKKDVVEKNLKLGNVQLILEIADTGEKRAKGLSGRSTLPQNRGMLFIFAERGIYPFWMKEMNFPLDFIWIDGQEVVDINQNIPYQQGNQLPSTVSPKVPVDKVIEVNAGVVNSSGIKVGDVISGL